MGQPFARKQVIDDAVSACVALFARYHRGDVVPWHTVEAAAGFGRDHVHWDAIWPRVKDEVRRQPAGIVLWARHGVGAELLTLEDQLGKRSRKRHMRAGRQLHKDRLELAALPDGELTDHQRVEKQMRMESARVQRNAVMAADRRDAVLAAGVTPPAWAKAG